ncbi:MAG: tryptophan--tRNA ligase [DPANN group archaeon]|nr:tryptophan--tRNA ligase [DPANN group archaeon]
MGDNIGLDPWSSAEIKESDYGHLFREFGIKHFKNDEFPIDHYLFKRGIIIAHRDFDKIFDRIEKGGDFINMTAVASSGKLHLGHKAAIDLFKVFKQHGAKNYFGIADIDGYTSRPDIKVGSMVQAKQFGLDNLTDALALGLSPKDVYVQSNYLPRYYELTFELSKRITENTYRAIYGSLDLGKVSAVILQMADILHGQLPEFEGRMPSITPIGLEQDPHMRLARDLAHKLPYNLFAPSSIYVQHQGGLKEGGKMSSSDPYSAIFLSDEPEVVDKKVKKAVTGGRDTEAEQRKLGGRAEICNVYHLAKFHVEDDEFVKDIFEKCKSGQRLCGECKQLNADKLVQIITKHHKQRKKVEGKAREIMGL